MSIRSMPSSVSSAGQSQGSRCPATKQTKTIAGTVDPHLGAEILSRAIGATLPSTQPGEDSVHNTAEFFKELGPKDPLEAMLISQLYACNAHCTKLMARAANCSSADVYINYLKLSERLMRAFASSMEALEKYRRGGQQSVKVEHVHVNAGGQAIVGHVSRG